MQIESQISPMVLLGAGASVNAGIPTAVKMTQKMIEQFQSYTGLEDGVRILKFVVERLQCMRGIKREEPCQGVDIEELFAAIEMLARRQELNLAPFVDRWNPLVEELEQHKCSFAFSPAGKVFASTAQYMIQMLMELVWLEDPHKVDHLLPLIQQGKEEVFTIATLNYDNTIELAGKATGVPVTTGIEHWSQYGKFQKPERGIELLKLHGSIDWSRVENTWTRKIPIPHETIRPQKKERVRFPQYQPALVFGAGNKLSARGPFLDLLQVFQQRLEEHDKLLVVGYSFRDEHINEAVISRWFNKSTMRRITVIDRKEATPCDNAFYRKHCSSLGKRFKWQKVGAQIGIRKFLQSDAWE